jgi:UDP-N-acetylglucosamine/UDP-N-acetylgalactosamine diphosphorylase
MAASSPKREDLNRIRKEFCDGGQGHVFDWWDDLTTEERESFTRELAGIDLDLMNRLASEHLGPEAQAPDVLLEPSPYIPLPITKEEKKREREARKRGVELIKAGKTAVFVVAGGQSSRLGLDMAKGKFPIMPVSGKSLFQHHSEKILAFTRRMKVSIPFFVMTSQTNHEETRTFFAENDHFGLPETDVFFMPQGMLPAMDFSGKFILKSKGGFFMSPDGHGGALKALFESGAVEEMEKRGIEYISYFQVDNPLVKVIDPVFLGYHDLEKAEMSSKVVQKRSPDEKVGVLGLIDGRPGVIEYSDLSEKDMNARDENGRLRFSAGNPAIHIFSVAFIRRCNEGGFALPYHKAEKVVPYLDETGSVVTPDEKNGIKYETFVFDAIQYAEKTMALEVEREEEFAPVKNAEGEDSPETSRRTITSLYRSWLEKAGFTAPEEDGLKIEISPLFAIDSQEFIRKVRKKSLLLTSKLFIQ